MEPENQTVNKNLIETVSSVQTTSAGENKTNKTLVIVFSLLLLILFGSTTFLAYQNFQLRKQIISLQQTPPSIPTTTPDPTANWKTYASDGISFKYPDDWVQAPKQLSGSGWSVEITDSQNLYTLTFSERGNYNQETGKPYATVAEFLGFRYQLDRVEIDGIQALRALPRAGSEHMNGVDFFSKDAKSIYSLTLEADRNRPDKIQEGQLIFDQILSTFKFLSSNEVVGININQCCPCPQKISSSLVGQEGWVTYEPGRDYSPDLPASCGRVVCKPCEPVSDL